jgi:methionine salvage enolase-phosphatase E1
MKSFKVRIFYNGYYDMNIDAPTEAHARDIIEDIALDHSEDVKLSYDFAEIDEVKT